AEAVEAVGGLEALLAHPGNVGGVDLLDVAFTRVEPADLGGIHVEAQDAQAGGSESAGQGQADVAEADDADAGRPGPDAGEQFCGGHDGSSLNAAGAIWQKPAA